MERFKTLSRQGTAGGISEGPQCHEGAASACLLTCYASQLSVLHLFPFFPFSPYPYSRGVCVGVGRDSERSYLGLHLCGRLLWPVLLVLLLY